MNTRREFFQNNLLSFAVFPFINKFNIVNNDNTPFNLNEIRWDIADRICDLFILHIEEKIKPQKNIISVDIYYDNTINDPKRFGIYGYCCSDNDVVVGTKIDWLKTYNVSPFIVMDLITKKLIKNHNLHVDKNFFIPEKQTRKVTNNIFALRLVKE